MARLPSLPSLPRFSRLGWRRQSLLISGGAAAAALALAVVVVGIWHLSEATFRSWFSFTFAPFVVVVLLGVLARAHHRIDVRAGRLATLDLDEEDDRR